MDVSDPECRALGTKSVQSGKVGKAAVLARQYILSLSWTEDKRDNVWELYSSLPCGVYLESENQIPESTLP